MNNDAIRDIPLPAVCAFLNLKKDACDIKQFVDDGYRISLNGAKWYDHEAKKGGGGAIDLVMHVLGCQFTAAIAFLGGVTHTEADTKERTKATPESKPPAVNAENLPFVVKYLTEKRGLDILLVDWCIRHGLIYADFKRNCVFRYGNTAAELRGTGDIKWRGMRGNISTPFKLKSIGFTEIALCESAIDAISYRQLHMGCYTVSIAGNSNDNLITQVVEYAKQKDIKVIGAFDNDKGGEIAYQKLRASASLLSVSYQEDRPNLKDWNNELLNRL